MTALLVLVNILLALLAIVLIVSVLMQEGNNQGLGAITGGAETFFGKNKGKSMEGKLEKITKIAATAFIVLAIVSTMLTARVNGTNTAATAADVTADTAEQITDVAEGAAEEISETAENAEAANE